MNQTNIINVHFDGRDYQVYEYSYLYEQLEQQAYEDGETFTFHYDFANEDWKDQGEFIDEQLQEDYVAVDDEQNYLIYAGDHLDLEEQFPAFKKAFKNAYQKATVKGKTR